MTATIVKRETRFAVHIPRTDYREDCHYVKEQVHYSDGAVKPRAFLVKGYLRPIWCTKVAARDHTDKKEFESVDRLLRRECTESDLDKTVAGMLEQPYLAKRPDDIKNSPYVYGYDQTSTSLIKLKSLKKNDFIQTPYTVSVFDIETDIETREILIAGVAFDNRMRVCVLQRLVSRWSNVPQLVEEAVGRYLPAYKGKLQLEVTIHDDEVALLKAVFKTANEWAPDFLAVWNIGFDIPRVLERLKEQGVNPVDVLCDQRIPRNYRLCRYKEGITKKKTASGKVKPISPSLQWHHLFCTSTWHAIDAMCVYRQIRMAKQEEPSYALDTILHKVLGSRKLSFVEADHLSGAKWHTFMQENYPIEYIVYNIYDCLGVLELDAKTKDLAQSLPAGAGMTDFARFNSNPKKIVDALFLFGLEQGRIVGTAAKPAREKEDDDEVDVPDVDDEMGDEEGDEGDSGAKSHYTSLDLKGWIQLLPQNLLVPEGLMILEDYPHVNTNVRGMVYDVDATSAYPTCTMVANVSKETCVNELISIEGVSEETFREQNLSMCLGGVNTLEYFERMFGLPSLQEVDRILGLSPTPVNSSAI